jgi:hypothetical protein
MGRVCSLHLGEDECYIEFCQKHSEETDYQKYEVAGGRIMLKWARDR